MISRTVYAIRHLSVIYMIRNLLGVLLVSVGFLQNPTGFRALRRHILQFALD